MQTKNTIKQLGLLFLLLFVAEGVFGFGLYWPVLISMKDKRWVFWLAFGCGLFLSLIYTQSAGLMSLFLVGVMAIISFVATGSGGSKWILVVAVAVNIVFDLVFGLSWNIWESLAIVLVSLLTQNEREAQESIKLNYK